jgi:hypothetical protein
MSMKFGTVKDHDPGMFLYMFEKNMARHGLMRLENLSWPNRALCRMFHKTKVGGLPRHWVFVLYNFFDLATPGLIKAVFHITVSNRGC